MPWMKGIARAFCKNRMDAEDLVGDTVLKVLLNADRYDTDRSFRLWVYVIMRNTYRHRLHHVGIVEPFWNVPECPSLADPCKGTIVKEGMDVVDELAKSSITALSALLYAQGYSYSEIADMHGVSVNIVKSRIHYGRMLIIKRLSG